MSIPNGQWEGSENNMDKTFLDNLSLVHFFFLYSLTKGCQVKLRTKTSEILHEICSSEDVFFVIIDQGISEFILGWIKNSKSGFKKTLNEGCAEVC